ncbi:YhgE/Pip domain-containing protein [Bacillus sp. S/N-304-OC-R1]|uniref:YhgE/Pip domain-containing protein n=1 Tax=Bacillus sp. S/N-304-OC-R1 TaxID=2758034 RepID=UPI001C8F0446|nr:YhgE/Pip domain-containing protein [Bacillus sp. S/N-304-OC-R1]MBY0121111.1 YhgE/Pip domain-containing protein [Bacillus sp. S/N-304-OC-R1]
MKNNLFKKELLSILRNRKLLIPIIAVMFIPILYSGMFLWAFWDPYDHLSDLPVAIVNEDQGADFEGKELHLGDELVSKLEDSKDFQFEFVNKEQGYKDLKNQKYYMLIEIPNNFSSNATTLLDDNPKKLKLIYVPNEGYNFLSAQIGGTAIEKIKASLSEKIIETYSETMFDSVSELADGLGKASDGAEKLRNGASDLKDGTSTIHEKLSLLAEKSIQFNEGVNKVNSGAKELADGTTTLVGGLAQLQEGHQKLENASKQLQAGQTQLSAGMGQTKAGIGAVNEKLPAIVAGTDQIETGAKTLTASLQQWQTEAVSLSGGVDVLQQKLQGVISQLPENSPQRAELEGALNQLKAGTAQLAGAAGKLSEGSSELATNIGTLNNGQKQLQQGMSELAKGSAKLEAGAKQLETGQNEFQTGMETFGEKFAEAKNGAEKLASGANTLAGGLGQLENGSNAIKDGTDKLKEGSGKLEAGTTSLLNGSNELAEKLKDGSDKASSVHANDKTYEMMGKPVDVKNEKINEVPNYGTGFAPYFLSLGLFVGALLLSIVFPLREPAGVPRSGLGWFASKFFILIGVGIVQALIAVCILLVGLKMEVQSVPLFILFAIMTSLTFIVLVQFLVTILSDPGRFIAIIILILQLTTSAGTFPLELIPKALQPISAFLPMTYSVAGFKAVISSGDFSYMWHNAGILGIFAVIFISGTIVYFTGMFKKRFSAVTE